MKQHGYHENCLPKKKRGTSAHVDRGACGISASIKGLFIPPFDKGQGARCNPILPMLKKQAQELFDRLMRRRAEREDITEKR